MMCMRSELFGSITTSSWTSQDGSPRMVLLVDVECLRVDFSVDGVVLRHFPQRSCPPSWRDDVELATTSLYDSSGPVHSGVSVSIVTVSRVRGVLIWSESWLHRESTCRQIAV